MSRSGLQALPLLLSSAAVAMAHGETAGTGDPAGRCAGPPAGTEGRRESCRDSRSFACERLRMMRIARLRAKAGPVSVEAVGMLRSEMAFAAPVKGELMMHRARDSGAVRA